MASPALATIKKLFALSGNRCAYPGCRAQIVEDSGVVSGEVCHIRARGGNGPRHDPAQSEDGRRSFDNLMLLCHAHHVLIDSDVQTYPVDDLEEIKAIHEREMGGPECQAHAEAAKAILRAFKQTVIVNNSGNIAVDSPGAVQGHNVTIKTSRHPISVAPPPGAIGNDVNMARYVEHLIRRYNKFASAEPNRKTKFNHGAISKNLSDKFGSKWQFVETARFEDLVKYLQGRIQRTRQARINKGKGHKAFSTYEEYLAKW